MSDKDLSILSEAQLIEMWEMLYMPSSFPDHKAIGNEMARRLKERQMPEGQVGKLIEMLRANGTAGGTNTMSLCNYAADMIERLSTPSEGWVRGRVVFGEDDQVKGVVVPFDWPIDATVELRLVAPPTEEDGS